jgi:hypothetical protein
VAWILIADDDLFVREVWTNASDRLGFLHEDSEAGAGLGLNIVGRLPKPQL